MAVEAVEASEPAAAISEAAVSAGWAVAAFAAEWVVLIAISRCARRQWDGHSRPFTPPDNFILLEASLRETSHGLVPVAR